MRILVLLTALFYGMFAYSIPHSKVVIWGHKLHTHTHSYVHYAFFKAFQSLGYPTYWFDDHDNTDSFDFSGSLFIVEGQVDRRIPLRNDCWYILHNCDNPKYQYIMDNQHGIRLQVYTDCVLSRNIQKIDDCIYYDVDHSVLYMPWATDLLPYEIDFRKAKVAQASKGKTIWWVGTIGAGLYGNINEITPFEKACKSEKFNFEKKINIGFDENADLVLQSFVAPVIVGEWQLINGYIPCRVFKNISYGGIVCTNSPRVQELFHGKLIFNKNTYQLFFDAKNKISNMTNNDELFELMDIVKEKHTYINRIQHILNFFDLVVHKKHNYE